MANTSILHRIMAMSPHIEILIRKFYWNNVHRLMLLKKLKRKFRSNKNSLIEARRAVDFSKITNFICTHGVGKGSLLVIHSSYDALKATNKTPLEIIDEILSIIGSSDYESPLAF